MEVFDERSVLLHRSHRNANPLGEFVAAHRADDEAAAEEGFENGVAIAHMHEHKIRGAGDKVQAHRSEFSLEVCTALVGEFASAAHVVIVGETSKSAGLGDAVCVERLAGFLKDLGDTGRREAIPDAKIGEALDFRKGPHDDDIPVFTHIAEDIRLVVKELVVGLVENYEDMVGHAGHESVDRLLADERASGVVGIRDENLTRARRDRGKHGVEVVGEIRVGDLDGFGAEKLGHQRRPA